MRIELANVKQMEINMNDNECDICHDKYIGYIVVEDDYKTYCFTCYNREFGHARFMRRYREMDIKMQNEGFDKY